MSEKPTVNSKNVMEGQIPPKLPVSLGEHGRGAVPPKLPAQPVVNRPLSQPPQAAPTDKK